MKIVLAFDSFKGSLSAVEVCAAAATGIARLSPLPDIVSCPLSDGGEGFAEALRLAANGTRVPLTVTGPLFTPVEAELVLLDDGQTAVIEAAHACGLGLVPPEQRSPLRTTTRGVGEMLQAAIAAGARRIILGLGGSSTNDAGMGLLEALGWRFWDAQGERLAPVGGALAQVARIEPGATYPDVQLIAACDVTNPLYGPAGAAYTYARQKGAGDEEIAALDAGLAHFAAVCAENLGKDEALTPGAGAAGGLGFALLAFLGAEFRAGARVAIETSGLDAHLADADLCFTGEGRTDGQTVHGKLPAAVAACCARAGVPCVCLSGSLGDGWHALYALGCTAAFSITQRPQTLDEALANTATALADAAEGIARLRR